MERIAKFEKVSYEQFKKGYIDECFPGFYWNEQLRDAIEKDIMYMYDILKLPVRATSGSAGYDFFTPMPFTLKPTDSITLPTGIRVKMKEGWVLQCFPRSGLGSKYRLQLNNTVGIIDSDYYYSDNEGQIFAILTNDSKLTTNKVELKENQAFMQGVFVQYGITEDDEITTIRNGGFGSTG